MWTHFFFMSNTDKFLKFILLSNCRFMTMPVKFFSHFIVVFSYARRKASKWFDKLLFFFWCFKNQLLRYVMASYLSLVDGTSRQKLNILKVRSEPTTFTGLETSVYFRLTVGKQQWRKWKQKAQRYRNI